ncbi:MAG: MBG domain-containing protein, partial [Niameybacter sp.]
MKPSTEVYDGEKHTVGEVETSVKDAEVYYSVDGKEWSKEKPTFTEKGDYTVYVQARDKNYHDSKVFEAKVSITARPITITADSEERDYNGIALTSNKYTVSKDGLVKGQEIGSVEVVGSITNVGTAENTAKNARIVFGKDDTTDNYKIKYVNGILKITPAEASKNAVTVVAGTATYDGEKHGLKKVSSLIEKGTTFYYATKADAKPEEWTTNAPQYVNAGTYPVFVKAVNPNYKTADPVESSIVINKKEIQIKPKSATKVYGEEDPKLEASVEGLVKEDKATYTIVRETGEDVKEYTIEIQNAKASANYTIKTDTAIFKITPAEASKNAVTVVAGTATYDGEKHGLKKVSSLIEKGTTFYYATKADAKPEEWTTNAPQYVNAGTYPVFVKAVNPNYKTADPVESIIVIDKKVVTIQPIETSKIFGEKDKELIAQVTGMVQGDTIAYEVKRDAGENAGKYTIHIKNVAISDNYTVDTKTSTFTIHKASADGNRIFVKNVNKVYDGEKLKAQEAKALEGSKIEYSIDGGTTWKEAIPTRTNAGKTIVQVRATHPNFKESIATEEIVITKCIATIQANPAQKVYKESEPTLSAKLKNVVSGEEAQFEYTVERKTGENVGTYDITVTNVKELGNYEIKTEGAKFTINKASNDTNKVSVEDTKATY